MSTITLRIDSNSKYSIVYRSVEFNILVKYNDFIKAMGSDSSRSKKIALEYIESLAVLRDTIYLNGDSLFKRGTLGIETRAMGQLLSTGEAKVYDRTNQKYLNTIIEKKKKWSKTIGEGQDLTYMDSSTKRQFFSLMICTKVTVQ